MNRHACYHCGLDQDGNRHWRAKDVVAMRHHRVCVILFPKVVATSRVGPTREVWRNGLQRRRWLAVAIQVRAHRRSFRATLPRPALVPLTPSIFG